MAGAKFMQEKRSRPRLKVSMPVQVFGYTVGGEKFREVCQTHDASAFGLCLILEAIVPKSGILFLSMQMPRRLRLYDLSSEIYQIYAQVRRVHMLAEGGCEVGLSFIGKNPPSGVESYQTADFLSVELKKTSSLGKAPTGSYAKPNLEQVQKQSQPQTINPAPTLKPTSSSPEIPTLNSTTNNNIPTGNVPSNTVTNNNISTNPSAWERPGRRDARLNIPIDVMLTFLDSSGRDVYQEPGLVTNISRSGACVMATKEAPVGSRIKINMMRDNFEATSCIKAVTTGQGGVWNLHLEFIDRHWMGGS